MKYVDPDVPDANATFNNAFKALNFIENFCVPAGKVYEYSVSALVIVTFAVVAFATSAIIQELVLGLELRSDYVVPPEQREQVVD